MSSGPETVTQRSEPPAWAVPYFQNYLERAGQTSNLPYQPYSGSRVADVNPTQYAGMDATVARATQGTPEQSAGRDELTRTLQGGYLGVQAPTNPYLGATNPQAGVMNPYAGITNPQAGVRNESANPTNPYAGSNPYLDQAIDAAHGDVVRNFNLTTAPSFGTANARSGSFGNAGLAEMETESRRQLAGELGRISSGMRMQDYTQQQQLGENAANRQFQAGESMAQRLFGAGQQQAQNQYGAGSQFANQLFGSGESFANRLFQGGEAQAGRQQSGYESERGRMQGAVGAVPSFSSMDYQDIDRLLGIGNMQQTQQQRTLDDDYGRFTEARDYPLRQLDILGRALGGTNYGQSTTGQQPGSNLGAGALGGALIGSQLASGLGLSSGMGAGAGVLLGLLSDRRAKTDIRHVGITDDGLPIYTFRYRGSPETHMGVMADEVERVRPSAVHVGPDGFKRVDYSQIGGLA